MSHKPGYIYTLFMMHHVHITLTSIFKTILKKNNTSRNAALLTQEQPTMTDVSAFQYSRAVQLLHHVHNIHTKITLRLKEGKILEHPTFT